MCVPSRRGHGDRDRVLPTPQRAPSCAAFILHRLIECLHCARPGTRTRIGSVGVGAGGIQSMIEEAVTASVG